MESQIHIGVKLVSWSLGLTPSIEVGEAPAISSWHKLELISGCLTMMGWEQENQGAENGSHPLLYPACATSLCTNPNLKKVVGLLWGFNVSQ